jgi:uncharacterized phage protein gp47/JayE
MIPRPTSDEILTRIYNRIRNETPINAPLDSSAIGVILKIIAVEMDAVWNTVEDIHNQSNLSTATGASLDNFGLQFGVPRRQAKNATTAGYARAVKFTNNGVATVSVPSGTRVYKDTDPQIAFFTIEGANINPGQSGELHVTSAETGSIFNVGIGELNRHSLPNVSVTVTNMLPIQNGEMRESDSSYRERILQDIRRRDVLNLENTNALLRSIPGVRDVYVLDKKRGAGTFDAIIIPYNQSMSASIVAEAQRLLNDSIPIGISAVARPPQYRQLDIKINLRFSPDTGDRRDSVRESIRSMVLGRVDNLPVENGTGNGTFNTDTISAIATLADPSVLDAIVTLGLDGSPLLSNGEVNLGVGERLIIRSLQIQ